MKQFDDFEHMVYNTIHDTIHGTISKNKIKPMITKRPEPKPIEHTREFDRDEIKAALIQYLRSNGVTVPNGEVQLWGLNRSMNDSSSRLTLAIIQPIAGYTV